VTSPWALLSSREAFAVDRNRHLARAAADPAELSPMQLTQVDSLYVEEHSSLYQSIALACDVQKNE
jgi:hypothetical protein